MSLGQVKAESAALQHADAVLDELLEMKTPYNEILKLLYVAV